MFHSVSKLSRKSSMIRSCSFRFELFFQSTARPSGPREPSTGEPQHTCPPTNASQSRPASRPAAAGRARPGGRCRGTAAWTRRSRCSPAGSSRRRRRWLTSTSTVTTCKSLRRITMTRFQVKAIPDLSYYLLRTLAQPVSHAPIDSSRAVAFGANGPWFDPSFIPMEFSKGL